MGHFAIGDVVEWWSDVAGKQKYHLAISYDGHFLFLNSPKQRSYPGDMIVDCSDIGCITPTDSGKSIISCSTLMSLTEADLVSVKARKRGTVGVDLLKRVAAFVQSCPVLTEEQRDAILNACGDWWGG